MMKKPARYIITGVDATGVSTPVLEVPQEAQNWWAEYFIAVGGK